MTEEEKKAIETVDKIIKRMEENEEYLRKQKNYLEGLLGDKVRKIIKLGEEIKELKSNSILKDKIREKIKVLEIQAEEFKNLFKSSYAMKDEYLYTKVKIQGYKELLEEE